MLRHLPGAGSLPLSTVSMVYMLPAIPLSSYLSYEREREREREGEGGTHSGTHSYIQEKTEQAEGL